jgi:thermolabile hemolysin
MSFKVLALATAFLALPTGIAFALPINTFSQIVAFGDSLSDAGNASIATLGAFPGSNYATRSVAGIPFPVGYYTDGPTTTPSSGTGPTGLWIDQLAARMSLTDPVPALAPGGGTNYAVGSAMTGSANLQDMQNQVSIFLTAHPSASNSALYVFWGGANDLLFGGSTASGKQAADNIFSQIQQVAGGGGKYFLWVNMPPLGNTPLGSSNQASLNSSALNTESAAFNAEWQTDLNKLNTAGIYTIGVDVSSLFNQLISNPAANGFSNVTDTCRGNPSCTNPNTFLFWDDEHPTTQADMYIADLALSDLQAAPEPTAIGLFLLGGCGLVALRKAQRKPVRRN